MAGGPGQFNTVSLAKVRDALTMMVGLLVLLWTIQAANWADDYRLNTPQTSHLTPHPANPSKSRNVGYAQV